LAVERSADIVTGDRDDIERLVAASGARIAIVDVGSLRSAESGQSGVSLPASRCD
jgi:hypothetical protein